MVRKPAVAGQFYPKKAEELRTMIKGMVDPQAPKEKALAVVSPHAGFIYSGYVAGAVFSSVEIPAHVIIMGPSHRGMRALFGMMTEGAWQTPLGDVPLDSSLARAISERSTLVKEDAGGHAQEHSLEVQLPFIQYLRQDFSFVPICVSPMADYSDLRDLGAALAGAIKDSGGDTLVVASTDMSHYISQEAAKKKDFLAIEKVLALDARGLYEIVRDEDITMCGFQPTTAAILAAKELGAKKAELIRYQTMTRSSGTPACASFDFWGRPPGHPIPRDGPCSLIVQNEGLG
jgi:AmmeMemoRadiSam system protein B